MSLKFNFKIKLGLNCFLHCYILLYNPWLISVTSARGRRTVEKNTPACLEGGGARLCMRVCVGRD